MVFSRGFSSAFVILLFVLITEAGFSQGFICAVGGGSEGYNDWSNAPYQWMVQKAVNRKIIILSYSDATNWLPDYFKSLGAVTVYNKKINTRTIADQQATYDELITADGIFLRGGDQNQYITLWKGTKTEQALVEIFQRGGVIGGTSAGAMVLGQFNYTAKNGSASSKDGLNNPLGSLIDIDTTFLKLIPDVLFDTHFIERGRFGRLIAMVFKAAITFEKNILGVGIDDKTAICIDSTGIGTVMGSGAVAIYQKDEKTTFSTSSSGYVIDNLKCDQLTANWSFDFINKKIHHIPASAKEVDTSRVWNYPITDFYLTGSNAVNMNLNSNIPAFLNNSNSESILLISHPGFQSSLAQITNYLANQNYTYDSFLLNNSILNDPASVQKMNNTTSIIICGDSLGVLSLLQDTLNSLAVTFYNKVNSGTPVFFMGNSGKIAGEKFIDNVDTDYYASYRGRMTNNTGLSLFEDLIFQPLVFENSDYFENRSSSVLWGLMLNRKRFGVYLDGADRVVFKRNDKTISGNGSIPFIIVDARSTTKVDSSTYRASSSIAPRQVVAMNNLRYSVSRNKEVVYSIQKGEFTSVSSVKTKPLIEKNFVLHQNYPNPFNPVTTIKFAIPKSVETLHASTGSATATSLRIYDVLGREVAVLVNSEKSPGTYEIKWDASGLSSGIYFYRLTAGSFIETRKMLLLR
jgi:cyanophycinase